MNKHLQNTAIALILAAPLWAGVAQDSPGQDPAEFLQAVGNAPPTRVSVSDVGSGDTAGDKVCIVTTKLSDGGMVKTKLFFMPSRNKSVIRSNDEHYNNKLNEFFTVTGYQEGQRKPYIMLSAHRDPKQICIGAGCLMGFGKKSSDPTVVGNFEAIIQKDTERCKKEAYEQAHKGTATDLSDPPEPKK